MSKDNLLYGVIGLLAGLILGFIFTNAINQSAPTLATAPTDQNANLPPGHPSVPNQDASSPQVQAAIEEAKKQPENFESQVKAAEMYYQINRYDDAIEFLLKANKLKPDHYETIVGLGNAYFDASKFDEAEKWYNSALSKKSDDVNVRTDLGLTFMFRDSPDYDRAINEFLKSLETSPNHSQTLQNLTVAYTKKMDAEKATETLSKLEKSDSANVAIPALREEIAKVKKGVAENP